MEEPAAVQTINEAHVEVIENYDFLTLKNFKTLKSEVERVGQFGRGVF